MKSKSLIVGNVIIFAIGLIVCLIHGHEGVLNSLLLVTGLLFLIPGVVNLLMLIDRRGREDEKKASGVRTMMGWISTAAAIILGAMIIITPGSFKAEFMFIVGALLVLFAITLAYMMGVNLKAVKLPWWMYILPGLVLVDGIVIACMTSKPNYENTLALLMGIGLMAVAVSFFMTLIAVGSHNRSQRKAAARPQEPAHTATPSAQTLPAETKAAAEPEDAEIISEEPDPDKK